MKHFAHYTLLIAVLLVAIQAKAQNVPKKIDEEGRKAIAEKFEDEKVVAHTYVTSYEFRPNLLQKTIAATEKHSEHYVNVSEETNGIYRTNYYDDNSEVYALKNSCRYETTKMKIDGLFHHDMMLFLYSSYFSSADRLKNIYIEKKYNDSRYLISSYFQMEYPVLNRKIEFKIPSTVEVELLEFNFDAYDIQKNVKELEGFTTITYIVKDLPKAPKYDFAPPRAFYAPHIIILSKGVKGSKNYSVLANTQDQYNWYQGLVKGAQNDQEKIAAITKDITADADSDLEKVKKVFYWVQDNIDYIAFEDGIAGFQPENCQTVYNNRYGDCKGMANLLTEMLSYCGIDVRRTWIGTNSVAYDYSIPSLAVDNHAIATVYLDGKTYYLDATEKYAALGDYAERIQGRQVLIEDGENYILDSIPANTYKRNKSTIKTNLSIEADGRLKGKISFNYNGESKILLMNQYHRMYDEYKDRAIVRLINKGDNNIHIDQVEEADFSTREGSLLIESDVSIENKTFAFGEELYLDWNIYPDGYKFEIDSSRTLAYFIDQKVFKEVEYAFSTPEGYKLKEVPEDISIVQEDYQFEIAFDQSNANELVIKRKTILPNGKIKEDNIKAWNKTIEELKEKYNDSKVIYEKI